MDFTTVLELKSRTRDKDVLALIQFIEGQRDEIKFHCATIEESARTIKKLEKRIGKAEGNQKPPACPCMVPDDHAGWCPRRER